MPNLPIRYNFCPQCGKPLLNNEVFGQTRPNCPDCSYVHWGNFSLGVGGIVWHEDKILLVQRAHNPGKGMWTIPGGYVDQAEKIADAIVREIWEETGIIAEPKSVLGLRDHPGEKHDSYVVFMMDYRGGTLKADPNEVSDLGFYSVAEYGKLAVASLSLSVIEASRLSDNKGFFPQQGVKMSGEQAILYHVPRLR